MDSSEHKKNFYQADGDWLMVEILVYTKIFTEKVKKCLEY